MEAANNYLVVKKEIIEEQRSPGGIILNVSSVFDYTEEFSKKNVCKAEVIFANPDIPFLKSGERIVMNPNKGRKAAMDWNDYTVITSDQYIAKIDKDGRYIVPPACIMIKIKEEDIQSLYTRWILRDDGTKVQLFIQPEPNKDSTQRSKIFVSLGEIMQIGSDVKGIEVGDIAILDYTVDNDMDNVLYYDENKDKFIVIIATTVLHDCDEWAYATRRSPNEHDVLVSKVGDIETFSPILGLIRNDKLIARFPYVFINHLPTKVEKVSQLGITYSENEFILEREILSVSDDSKKRYGMKDGQKVLVQDCDIFSVQLKDGKIDCIMDSDIMMSIKKIKS